MASRPPICQLLDGAHIKIKSDERLTNKRKKAFTAFARMRL